MSAVQQYLPDILTLLSCGVVGFVLGLVGGGGSILVTSSVAAEHVAYFSGIHYATTKTALVGFVRHAAFELGRHQIRVNAIGPGYIDTPMTQVNEYPMPFKLPVDEAARRFAHAIAQQRKCVVIPWQMGVVAKLLRLLPNPLFDRLLAGRPRKRRKDA